MVAGCGVLASLFWSTCSILLLGIRPSKRVIGIFLGVPFLSVSSIAWLASNPFNGIVFAFLGIIVIFISAKLPRERVQIAPLWAVIPGIIMFLFGWGYPHFLDSSSFLPYVYSAPTGIIPCPTLSMVIGSALILNGLGSRIVSLMLGISGILFGITGVVQLGVSIDVVLLGSIVILTLAFVKEPGRKTNPA